MAKATYEGARGVLEKISWPSNLNFAKRQIAESFGSLPFSSEKLAAQVLCSNLDSDDGYGNRALLGGVADLVDVLPSGFAKNFLTVGFRFESQEDNQDMVRNNRLLTWDLLLAMLAKGQDVTAVGNTEDRRIPDTLQIADSYFGSDGLGRLRFFLLFPRDTSAESEARDVAILLFDETSNISLLMYREALGALRVMSSEEIRASTMQQPVHCGVD